MLWLLIRKEIVSHVLSLRFGVTFILFLVLIFASIYVSVNEFRQEATEQDIQTKAGRDSLANIAAEKDNGARANLLRREEGVIDVVPVKPLAWIGQGLQSALPLAIRSRGFEVLVIDRGLNANPLLGLLRVPDFVYVVNIVLSLLAILFMFDAVCGEKESGTLRLMLANPAPRHQVLLGKWLGGYAVLLVPFLLAVAGGFAYAYARGALTLSSDTFWRLLVLVLTACLYIAIFFNLSLFISSTTHHASTSLLVCLLVWVIFIVAIPNLAPVTAKIVEPLPSMRKIEAEKAAIDREIYLQMSRLSMYGEVGYGSTLEDARDKLDKERQDRRRQWDLYYRDLKQSQLELAGTLGRLSPSACWTYAAVALADTGPDAYGRLDEAQKNLGQATRSFWERLNDQRGRSPNRQWPAILIEQLPHLKVSAPGTVDVINSALNDILILVILNVVFFMLAFACFLRYNVT